METTHLSVSTLVDRIDRGELKLPEIQRGYVWKPPQVARLFESLYRGYPSGAMLLWRPAEQVAERAPNIDGPSQPPAAQAQYLLDGQQRLTSLHRVFKQHDRANIVFNVETQLFQVQSVATAKDGRWVRVAEVLTTDKPAALRRRVLEAHPELDEDEVEHRLERLRGVNNYMYYLEILTDLEYAEVAEIFVRVNSGGRSLKTVDLTLALLSVQWPGVVAKVDDAAAHWEAKGWPKIDAAWLVRALAATVTSTASLAQLRRSEPDALEAGWAQVLAGLDLLIKVLADADIRSSTLLPSANSLIPLVTLLGTYDKKPLEDSNAIVYWLLGVAVTGRYSSAADTKIAQDSLAARSDNPLEQLYRNAGLLDAALNFGPDQLIGKGSTSSFFLLSYLASKREGAKNWFHDVEITDTSEEGAFAIEYHHIHPQATLRGTYYKRDINDLANLAFISATANKKISDRSPADYFPELLPPANGADQLTAHFVPKARELRSADAYPQFLSARRELLATAMTELLNSYRPASIQATHPAPPEERRSVSVTLFAGPAGRLVFDAQRGDARYTASCDHAEFERFLQEANDSVASSVDIGAGQAVSEPDRVDLNIPVGPYELVGTVADWRAVLARELADARLITDMPRIEEAAPLDGRVEFAALDTD